MYGEPKSGVQCVEFEALLADALDSTLHGATLAGFEEHQKSCPACAAMFQEASAGKHWLMRLEDIEPPKHLVHNILAQTIGTVAEASTKPAPPGESWLDRLKGKIAPVFAPVVTPRFAMSFGMAFFSITMLANIAGLHVADLKHVDMSAKGIQKTYYSTQARVVRYYENIRLVYEIESRVRDLRRVATPQNKQEGPTPKGQPKSDYQQDNDRHNQNSSRDVGPPALASSPASSNQVMDEVIDQARLNRRTA